MKGKRFNEAQIVGILREGESAKNVRDVCRKHGISEVPFYRWRNAYGGMTPNHARRVKELEAENSRLKKMVAEQALDIQILKEINSKNW
jgi:putative transposase